MSEVTYFILYILQHNKERHQPFWSDPLNPIFCLSLIFLSGDAPFSPCASATLACAGRGRGKGFGKIILCLSYLSPCGPFYPPLWSQFSGSLQGISLHLAVYLLCPWEKVSSGSSYTAILSYSFFYISYTCSINQNVLVCQGCGGNEMPRSKWLKDRHLFFTIIEATNPGPKCQKGRFLLGPPSSYMDQDPP